MPFERYLQHNSEDNESDTYSPQHEARTPQLSNSSTFSNGIQFQMPQFMNFGPPTLAPGGGAEVLPPSMFSALGDMQSAWLNNNLFSSKFLDQSTNPRSLSYDSSLHYKTATSSSDIIGMYTHLNNSDSGISDPGALPLDTQGVLLPEGPILDHSVPFATPSAFGLPVYSTSGFDLISIMARVANRPNPTLTLGPVDMSCSFIIVDVRRYDSPIVYASPSFYSLTGYAEHEVLGRNCRFLQAPDGCVQKGEDRRFTSPQAVSHLKKCLVADKECQTSMFNYKKGGSAFINLISVIPIPGGVSNLPEEADQVAYHIGFQVDLTVQPDAILQRVRGGTYHVNYSHSPLVRSPNPLTAVSRDRRSNASSSSSLSSSSSSVIPVSKRLRTLLADDKFVKSIPASNSTALVQSVKSPPAGEKNSTVDLFDGNKLLSMMLLESSPDFIHVLSLRGSFLYVAPSIRRVLGYSQDEVIGKSISDYCHPADLVPLMRELKESSTVLVAEGQPGSMLPKTVDLLFRILSKSEGYVWAECRGRLYVEPGKGRKAIILSGRKRAMPKLTWSPVAQNGGVLPNRTGEGELGSEFWGIVNQSGMLLSVSAAVRDMLGWGVGEVIGKRLVDFISPGDGRARQIVHDAIHGASINSLVQSSHVEFEIQKKDTKSVQVTTVLYHCSDAEANPPDPVICQIKKTNTCTPRPIIHTATSDVFEELDTTRNTSWQYELQQLKFANQRLQEELEALEFKARKTQPSGPPMSSLVPSTAADAWVPSAAVESIHETLNLGDARHWEQPLDAYMGQVHHHIA